jgi:hypothetical protein
MLHLPLLLLLMMFVLMMMLRGNARFRLSIRLPLFHPLHELAPVLTLMDCAESRDAAELVLDFDSQIELADERLAQQVDTVAHMPRGDHVREVCVRDAAALDGRVVSEPESLADAVLLGMAVISARSVYVLRRGGAIPIFTYQAV